ncbi:MAG: hypothetical protein ACR2FU_09340 [Streptosporangiaceae bacterium]
MTNYWPAGLLAVLAVAGCGPASTAATTTAQQAHAGPVPGGPVPASAIHRLTALAERAVKATEGHGVTWASVVVTTRAKALTSATPGDFVPHDQKTVVDLVTIKGHFTAVLASGPPGAKAPRGTYLSVVIGAKTFAGLDNGLGSKAPPVRPSSLGPVTYLKVQR